MSITRGAKKAHRSSRRKREFNLRRKDKISRAVKSLKKLVAAGQRKEAEAMMREVQSALDKAVKSRMLKKNTVARKKARFAKLVKTLKS